MKLFGYLADRTDISAPIQTVGLTSQFEFLQDSLSVEVCNWSIRYQFLFQQHLWEKTEMMSVLYFWHMALHMGQKWECRDYIVLSLLFVTYISSAENTEKVS